MSTFTFGAAASGGGGGGGDGGGDGEDNPPQDDRDRQIQELTLQLQNLMAANTALEQTVDVQNVFINAFNAPSTYNSLQVMIYSLFIDCCYCYDCCFSESWDCIH